MNVNIIKFVKELIPLSINNSRNFQSWGEDNNFPNHLINLYETIPEHSSCLDFIESLIVGQGLNIDKIDYWMVKKIIFDYLTFGGYTVQVIKLRNGITTYSYVDISNVRYSKDKKKLLFSENWNDYKSQVLTYEISDGTKNGIYIFKNNKSKNLYPKPYYLSNTMSLDTLSKIIKYHNNNATNGFTGNVLINIPGVPDETVQEELEKKFEKKFTGGDGQKFILSFSNNKDDAVTIDTIGTGNLDEKFKDLQLFLRDEIIIGHKLTSPNLIGVTTSGNGFNKVEYEESLTVFRENIILGFRNEITYSLMKLTGVEDIQFLDKEQKNNIVINQKEILN